MPENPYAPPHSPAMTGPGTTDDGITFNDYDLERVSRATSWMRRVSAIQFFLGAGLVVFTLYLSLSSRLLIWTYPMLIAPAAMLVYAALLLLGAIWLRQSCIAFWEGTNANTEKGLAIGFRKLRLYLILYGVFGLVGLAGTLLKLTLLVR